jgi:hypothetical protein
MVPLKIFKNGHVHEIRTEDFSNGIIELCEKHREQSRALAFAFLIYDFRNPQIIKVLEDMDYWRALDAISGKFLSIYYIHSSERHFAEDLAAANDVERRGMHPINARITIDQLAPMLKRYLALDNNVKLPSILFFQVEGKLISDYFLIELFEESIEKSFIELKDYIVAAVKSLKMIDPEYYVNFQPIFESLKQGVDSTRFRKVIFRNVQKFPVQLLLSWVIGKA